MNEKKKWFVTYSEVGPCDPDGFYCAQCIEELIYLEVKTISNTKEMNPENSPTYQCTMCRKDYRDEANPAETKYAPPKIQQEPMPRAKDLLRLKAQVLIPKPHLLGLSQAKFNRGSSPKRPRNLFERCSLFFSHLLGLSSKNHHQS